MSTTSIEWTERVWNPFAGCSVLSPGCTNCYAMKMARRIEACNAGLRQGHGGSPHYAGTTKIVNGSAVWTGKIGVASDDVLTAPLRRKKPTTYFVNSMSDLFHENVPDEAIDKVFAVMALTPQHTYQILTKRSARMRAYCSAFSEGKRSVISAGSEIRGSIIGAVLRGEPARVQPLPNVWLGVSTERQKEADERIPDLLATPAAVRFISAEPLLSEIDLTVIRWRDEDAEVRANVLTGEAWVENSDSASAYTDAADGNTRIDWVIAGGESGPGARPMHPDWVRSLRDQCAAAGSAFFFKQWGEYLPEGQFDAAHFQWAPGTGATVHWWQPEPPRGEPLADAACSVHVGKKAAGRLLDGAVHDGTPEAAR